jgi:hypothetical protein
MQRRLQTVDGKQLVDFLARAKRLGYGETNLFDDADEETAVQEAVENMGSDVEAGLVSQWLVGGPGSSTHRKPNYCPICAD